MIDEKDSLIIEELKLDSRASIRDIAKKTSLRPSTVHQRMQKLQDKGVIEKYTVKLNSKAVDESLVAFIMLTTEADLPNSFFKNQHIKEVFGITGENDLIIKLKFKDITDFNNYLIELRKNKSITKTQTFISTITIKEDI